MDFESFFGWFDGNGTLSDWAMILVTSITAVFLYKTLEAQRKSLKTQTEGHKFEKQQYLQRIKPEIEIAENVRTKPQDTNTLVTPSIILTVKNYKALELSSTMQFCLNGEVIKDHVEKVSLIEANVPINIGMESVNVRKEDSRNTFINVHLEYLDIEGNIYKSKHKIKKNFRGRYEIVLKRYSVNNNSVKLG